MEMHSENWEETAPDVEAELKKMRKNLRRRSWTIILTSLVLAAAMLLCAVKVVMPQWEKRYWDPNTKTLEPYSTDLTVALDTYAELFSVSQSISHVNATRTGFASYSLSVAQWFAGDGGDIRYLTASLEKNRLSFPDGFWEYSPGNVFVRACWPEYDMGDEWDRETRERLEGLPDYIWVTAAVSFPQDLSMVELIDLADSLEAGNMEWVGIRVCGMDRQMYPLCGMKPYSGGILWENMNEYYPHFQLEGKIDDPEALEAHFTSLLQFSLDQVHARQGVSVINFLDGPSYYEEALQYVEENGVASYGCYLSAPAGVFLELMDSGAASQVWIMDAWVHV